MNEKTDADEGGERVSLLYDATLKRPGCVLLQAVAGCGGLVAQAFPAETWLTHPTPGMKRYSASKDELRRLVQITKEHATSGTSTSSEAFTGSEKP